LALSVSYANSFNSNRREYAAEIKKLKKSIQTLRDDNVQLIAVSKLISDSEHEWKEELRKYSDSCANPEAVVRSLCVTVADLKE
jgi:SMC interacting uncharacterized protein involved in chromosome segregation